MAAIAAAVLAGQAGALEQQDPQVCEASQPSWHLPWELLVLVLQHIDLPARLSTASVSSAWHTAALAATDTIQHRSSSKETTAVLQDWLATHGRSVLAVQLSAAYHCEADLQLGTWDCPRLQSLGLSHMTLTHLSDDSSSTASSSSRSAGSSSSTSSTSSTSDSSGADGSSGAGTSSTAAAEGQDAPAEPSLMLNQSIQQGVCSFAAFSNLTSLALQYCCLSSLASLAAAPGLTHLRLEKPQPPGFSAAAAAYTLDAAALAPLQRLTSLQIIRGSYRQLLSTVCSFVELRDLQLLRCRDQTVTSAGFEPGQLWQKLTGLTALLVEAVPGLPLLVGQQQRNSRSALPLQQLLRLEVTAAAGFDPMLLSAATALQHLQLTSTPLVGGAAGTAALLAALSHITGLRHLNLRGTLQQVAPAAAAGYLHDMTAGSLGVHAAAMAAAAAGVGAAGLQGAAGVGEGSGVAAYAALTASSTLQHLDLSRCLLPPRAVAAMFASSSSSSSSSSSGGGGCAAGTARLPLLQQLLLSDSFALLSAGDMQGLVTSCPSLQKLDLIRATPYDTPLPASMLALLPSLHRMTQLSMTNVDDAAAAQLARLTGLESLSIVWQSSITDQGVQELTALRRLTHLWVHGALSSQLAPGFLLSLQSKELPPDVWSRLKEACSNCVPS